MAARTEDTAWGTVIRLSTLGAVGVHHAPKPAEARPCNGARDATRGARVEGHWARRRLCALLARRRAVGLRKSSACDWVLVPPAHVFPYWQQLLLAGATRNV